MTEETTFLEPDGVGVSPLADYPGRIVFPLVMTLPMHKQWQAFVNGRVERDPDAVRIGVAFVDKTGDPERMVFQYDDAELALMFGKLDVTGPDGKKISEKTLINNLPLPVAVWIAKCYREWENSQLLFRWNGVAGMAPSVVG